MYLTLAIASILFSNLLFTFLQYLFIAMFILTKKTIIKEAQREITVYTLQSKTFNHSKVVLFQLFLEKSEKLIRGKK